MSVSVCRSASAVRYGASRTAILVSMAVQGHEVAARHPGRDGGQELDLDPAGTLCPAVPAHRWPEFSAMGTTGRPVDSYNEDPDLIFAAFAGATLVPCGKMSSERPASRAATSSRSWRNARMPADLSTAMQPAFGNTSREAAASAIRAPALPPACAAAATRLSPGRLVLGGIDDLAPVMQLDPVRRPGNPQQPPSAGPRSAPPGSPPATALPAARTASTAVTP